MNASSGNFSGWETGSGLEDVGPINVSPRGETERPSGSRVTAFRTHRTSRTTTTPHVHHEHSTRAPRGGGAALPPWAKIALILTYSVMVQSLAGCVSWAWQLGRHPIFTSYSFLCFAWRNQLWSGRNDCANGISKIVPIRINFSGRFVGMAACRLEKRNQIGRIEYWRAHSCVYARRGDILHQFGHFWALPVLTSAKDVSICFLCLEKWKHRTGLKLFNEEVV